MNVTLRALLLALVTSGCVRSELDPSANVQVVGRLVLPGGLGASGVEVALWRSAGNLCQAPLEPVAQGATDADGRYEFFLRGSDTQLDGLARCFRVTPAPAQDGTQASAELLLQVTRPVLPALLHAPFGLAGQDSDGGQAISFRDLAPEAGGGTLRLALRDAAGQSAWELEGPREDAFVDGPLLEDFAGLGAQLRLEQEADGAKTRVALAWESPWVPLGAADVVPVSRGAACSFGGEPGCPLTDGALRPVNATADNQRVEIAFATPVFPAELVVRGFQSWATARSLEVTATTASGLPVVLGTLKGTGPLGGFQRLSVERPGEPLGRLSLRWLDETGQAVNVTGLSEVSVFGAP